MVMFTILFVILFIMLIIVILQKLRVPFKAPESPSEPKPSTPSSSWPITPEASQFDVFISFRGKDTRKGFTGHLLEGFKLRGVSTFIDSENLERGGQIESLLEYIEKSKICIPIFSKGYADSKWRLKEFAKIVECNKKVIPVFFDVDPYDVKNQSGPFASGFKKHESNRKLKQQEVRKWREALTKVGNISGFTLKDTDGYEAKLVQIIVKRVLDEVNPCCLHVGEYIVGHESHLKKLMRAIKMESNDVVRMIGIHGMGGIGKTTIAKAVYNKISSEFDACGFISNVREYSEKSKGLESLQQQLLKEVIGYDDQPITYKGRGILLIKEKIRMKKVLIILDDVDSRDQLLALVGNRDWFREGSRIIITRRDIKPLINHGVKVDEIYELKGLNHEDSIKLFCYHAFRCEKPPNKEYTKLCDEAVLSIEGLPLALEVLGSQFFNLNTPKDWRDLLELSKQRQHKEIFETLKLSYDSLDEHEKQVFLDMACFFIGRRKRLSYDMDQEVNCWWEVDDVIHFWRECGFHPELAIDVLKHKALIKINEYTNGYRGRNGRRFEMHDQIRDMGRKILEDEEKEGKSCSRLWNYLKVTRAFRKQRVPTSTEGIVLQIEEEEPFIAPHLEEMDDLRLFHIYGANFEGFPHFPEDLKWLGLPNCHVQMPSSVSIPKGLAVLDLYKNDDVINVLLETCRSRSMVFDKLKILDLSYTSITITPDFSNIPCLVKLTIRWCKELVEIHESVGQLKSLLWLNLAYCQKLEELPDTFSKLTSLELLSLRGCRRLLNLPNELGNLASLQYLDFYGAENIRTMPHFTRKLQFLEHLIIDEKIIEIGKYSLVDLVGKSSLRASCDIIDALPDPCCRTKTQLELVDNTVQELTDFLTRWENLETLTLNCKSLKALPIEVRQMQKLKVLKVYSNNLILPDDAIPLESIEKLEVKYAALEQASSLRKTKAENYLTHFFLKCTNVEVVSDWIGSSSKIKTLEIGGCKNVGAKILQQLGCFGNLTIPHVFKNLKILHFHQSPMIVTPNFTCLPFLEKLCLTNCKNLTEVHESIGSLKKLVFLKITGCIVLERLPHTICELRSLTIFDHGLKECTKLSRCPRQWTDQLESLMEPFFDGNRIVVDGTRIVYLPGGLASTSNWEFMDVLPKLFCESLHDLHFTNERIEKLTDSIGQFKNVQHMNLGCKMLKALPNSIGQLTNLKDLTIQCHTLTLFDRICMLESIERLSVECINLEPLPFSSTAIFVASPTSGCENLKEQPLVMRQLGCFSSGSKVRVMKMLELCVKQMTVTPDFSVSPCLEELTLRDCEMLTEVHHSIGTLNNLKVLSITGCNVLEGLPNTICHLTSLYRLGLTQEFNLSSSPEPSKDLENLGLCETGIKSIITSTRQLTKLRELHLRKSYCDSPHFKEFVLGWSSRISGSYLELVTDLSTCLLLQSVRRLDITDDQIEVLPYSSMGQMENLEELVLHCQSLNALPKWIGQLKQLRTLEVNCDNLTMVDEISSWENNLEKLILKCQSLKALSKLRGVLQLKGLRIFELNCENLTFCADICSMKNIERLKVRCLNFEPMLSSFGKLENVCSLELDCSSIEILPDFSASFGGLWRLSLSGCKNIKHLPDSMRQMERLRSLDLSRTGIVELPPWLGCLTNLTYLNLSNTQDLVLLSGLSYLTSLDDLIARNCHWVEDAFEGTILGTNQSKLERLDLSYSNFRWLPSCISNFSRLKVLNLSGCRELQSIPHLSSAVLRCLDVSGCKELQFIPHLSSSVLRELDASNCTNLRGLPDLSTFRCLEYLFLGGCNSLECIPGFETISEYVHSLHMPGPGGTIQCSNLSDYFKKQVFMQAIFQNLFSFKMEGNLIRGAHSGQQRLSFLFPDLRFICHNYNSMKLTLKGMISTSVDLAVMEDDHFLFETMLSEDDFDDEGSKTFYPHRRGKGDEIFEYLVEGSRTIELVPTNVSKLSKVELHVHIENPSRYGRVR